MITGIMDSLQTAIGTALGTSWSIYELLDVELIAPKVCLIVPNDEPEALEGYTTDGSRRFVTCAADVYLFEGKDKDSIDALGTAFASVKGVLGPRLGSNILRDWQASDFKLYEGDEDNPTIVLSGIKITANYWGTE